MTKIVKIFEVRDTRAYEESPDGRWRPVPGSGQSHDCARCQRSHEVHVEVALDDGIRAIIGTGCMGATDMVSASTVRSAVSRASRIARLRAELNYAREQAIKADRARAEVRMLPVPEIVRGYVTGSLGRQVPVVRVGNGPVLWCQFDSDREAEAVDAWRNDQIKARCPSPWRWRPLVEILERQLNRLEHREESNV